MYKRNDMDFETLEQKIEELNKIHPNANHKSKYRYKELYRTIYEALLAMEKSGEIVVKEDKNKRSLSYLEELLINDGPEFSYTFIFHGKEKPQKYKVGVCIRGFPICKPVQE